MPKILPFIKNKIVDKGSSIIKREIVTKKYINYLLSNSKNDLLTNPKDYHELYLLSFDGRNINAYEKVTDINGDYVILVHDINETLDDLGFLEQIFIEKGINVVKIALNNNPIDYSKAYLDVICLCNYLKKQHKDNRIYLYGHKLGANVLTILLKTDVKEQINGVILDKIEINLLDESIREFCSLNKYECYEELRNKAINQISNKYKNEFKLLDVPSTNIEENTIPLIFITDLNNIDYDYQKFLSIYNSTNGIKKILFIEKNIDKEKFKNEFYKVISELKKF